MPNDILGNLKAAIAIQAIVGNNTTEGTGVGFDTRSGPGYWQVAYLFALGISADALSGSVKFQPDLEESSDSTDGSNGTWTAVATADKAYSTMSLVDDPAEDDVIQGCEYKGDLRWVRPKVTFTGTHTNGTPISCICLARPRSLPPA